MVLHIASGSDHSYEFFYQVGLSEFGNFGTIDLGEGLNLRELLALSMETDESDGMTEQSQKEEIDVSHLESPADEDYRGHFNSTSRDDSGILCSYNHSRRSSHLLAIAPTKLHSSLRKTPLLPPPSRTKCTPLPPSYLIDARWTGLLRNLALKPF
jgi:hypothetical protein